MAHKKIIITLILPALVVIPIVIFFLSRYYGVEKIELISPLGLVVHVNDKFENHLEKVVKNELHKDNNYAVVVKNFENKEEYYYNQDKKFNSASLYKLWLMAVAFQEIKYGSLNKEDVLSASTQSLDDILSTSPTPTVISEGEESSMTINPTPTEAEMISMKAGEAIEKMITISDNYSALLISSRSGTPSVVSFLKGYGFSDSNYKQPPQTTAKDIAAFYEKLYKGEIVDREYSNEMIEILKRQSLNDRIPKYLPEDIEIAHKTGELFNSKHDAGIVFSKKGDYVIVVLSDTDDPNIAAEKIANLSKAIYEYFSQE